MNLCKYISVSLSKCSCKAISFVPVVIVSLIKESLRTPNSQSWTSFRREVVNSSKRSPCCYWYVKNLYLKKLRFFQGYSSYRIRLPLNGLRIIIPNKLRAEMKKSLHTGHVGIKTTKTQARETRGGSRKFHDCRTQGVAR